VVVLQRELADEWSIDHPGLSKLSEDDLVFLSNPCNPTGRVYSEEEIGRLATLTEKRGAWLVLDESFSHSADAETGFSAPVHRLGDRVVVVSSVSKNYLAQGWRLGAVFAAPAVLKKFAQVQTALLSPPASPLQSLIPAVLAHPIDSSLLGKRRTELYEHLCSLGFECAPSRGSFYLVPRRLGLSSAAAELRSRWRVYMLDGAVFGLADQDFFRLCVLQSEEDYQAVLRSLSVL
jgi:aspartate aminotransferase